MAHLTGARTERKINSIEVVSDDSLRVLRITTTGTGTATIGIREATESEWSTKTIATIDKDDAAVVATIFNGGTIHDYGGLRTRVDGVLTSPFSLPKPEEVKGPMDGDCTPLDIERARAANLLEERQNIQLQLERDHALDKHITADVKGCPACERAIRPGYGDGSLRPQDDEPTSDPELDALDGDESPLP